jgi:uncharacterized protein (DUF983 family)
MLAGRAGPIFWGLWPFSWQVSSLSSVGWYACGGVASERRSCSGYPLLFLPRSQSPAVRSIVRQLCPRCRSGRIFRSTIYWGFPKMNDRCPVCGLPFNREQGYFLGAMYISYGLALALLFVFGLILWVLTTWRLDQIAIWAVLFFLPFAPMLTFLSRVLWIYLDQTIDPETK